MELAAVLTSILGFLLNIIVLIIIIAVLVLIHEFGHFMAAKIVGVKVNEFAAGFGKAIWKKKIGETTYKINSFPLGGYVALEGEEGNSADPRSYHTKPWAAKAFILVGGVVMNLVLAVVLFVIFLAGKNYVVPVVALTNYDFVGTKEVNMMLAVTEVKDGPAQGKLEVETLITGINGQKFRSAAEFKKLLDENQGKPITLEVKDWAEGDAKHIDIDLPVRRGADQPLLYVSFYEYAYEIVYPHDLGAAINHSLNVFGYQLKYLAERIQLAIQKHDASIAGEQVGSIVAVGVIVGDLLKSGQLAQLINITSLVSLSLAFFNILPIPALDGGHLLIISLESLLRRKFNARFINTLNQVFFVGLMLFGVLFIFKDIIQYQLLNGIFTAIKSVFQR